MLGSICIVVDIHPRRSNWISSSKYLRYVVTISSCLLYLFQFTFLEVFIRIYRGFFIVLLSKQIITVLLHHNIIVHIRNIKKQKKTIIYTDHSQIYIWNIHISKSGKRTAKFQATHGKYHIKDSVKFQIFRVKSFHYNFYRKHPLDLFEYNP